MKVAERPRDVVSPEHLRYQSSVLRLHAREAVEAARGAIVCAERAISRSREVSARLALVLKPKL